MGYLRHAIIVERCVNMPGFEDCCCRLQVPTAPFLTLRSCDTKCTNINSSQGAALTHRAIEGLSDAIKSRIIAVVTFGDTQTFQDGGRINGYDTNRTLIICNEGDLVCTGTLYVFPVHFDYIKWVPTATYYLAAKLLEDAIVTPWPNGSFIFPNVTVPAIPSIPPAPQPTDAVPSSLPTLPPIPGLGDLGAVGDVLSEVHPLGS